MEEININKLQKIDKKQKLFDEVTKNQKQESIDAILKKIVHKSKCNLVITNLNNNSQGKYYCLIITLRKIYLVEKEKEKKTTTSLELKNRSIKINGEITNDYEKVLSKIIHNIVVDVQNKKAVIYNGGKI